MSAGISGAAPVSRRAFLRGGREEPAPVRPPWAVPDFADRCTGCGACAGVCPEAIIEAGPDGLARLCFDSNGCTFCGACAEACETRAIERRPAAAPFAHRAHITSACLTDRGIVCESCRDACPERAIRTGSMAGGVPRPAVEVGRCSGCGLCVAPCPAGAIELVAGPAAGDRG